MVVLLVVYIMAGVTHVETIKTDTMHSCNNLKTYILYKVDNVTHIECKQK